LGLSDRRTKVVGLDHYRFYALPIRDLLPTATLHLGEALMHACFCLAEKDEIAPKRVHTLQHGLTLDLLPHLYAILLFFGDVGTVDGISSLWAGRYDSLPHRFERETASRTKATFEDFSGSMHPVVLDAMVGKGFVETAKCLEVVGRNGNLVRIDFGRDETPFPRRESCRQDPYRPGEYLPADCLVPADRYREGCIMFLQGPTVPAPPDSVVVVPDPYDTGRGLNLRKDLGWTPIGQDRYVPLVRDLLGGDGQGFAGVMSLAQSRAVIIALERAWQAVQDDRANWEGYPLGGVRPTDWWQAASDVGTPA
jgi:hypothetical protein